MQHFTIDAARGLGGPDWLVERRVEAARRLADLAVPTAEEEIWRYSRIGELDLSAYRPVPAAGLNAPGDERVPGGGPWGLEAGDHAGMLVVQIGRAHV